jgi:hypothetical protein
MREADSEGDAIDRDRWLQLQHLLFGEIRVEIDGILTALARHLRLSGLEAAREAPHTSA